MGSLQTVHLPEGIRLDETLEDVRSRHFVGRRAELALLESVLEGATRRLVWVAGRGGIGKSFLVERACARLHARGKVVLRIDAEQLERAPEAVQREARLCPDGGALVFENFESCEGLWAWWKQSLLPELLPRVSVVVCSRLPSPPEWWFDPAWALAAVRLSLEGLPKSDALALAARLGVPEERAAAITESSDGHPLTLRLLADGDGGSTGPLLEAAVHAWLTRCSSDEQVDTLRVGMLTQWLTETLLADVLRLRRSKARRLCRWLETQPFVSSTKLGFRIHPLVAEAGVGWVLQGDPDAARALCRRLQEALADRLATSLRHEAAPLVNAFQRALEAEPHAWVAAVPTDWRLYTTKGATPSELQLLLSCLERHEGVEARNIADAWIGSGFATVHLVRDHTQLVRGYAVLIDLVPTEQVPVPDPVVSAWLEALRVRGPTFGTQHVVRVARFFGSFEHHQNACPELRSILDLLFLELFCCHHLAASASVHPDAEATANRPDRWLDLLARVHLGPQDFAVVGLDWRTTRRRTALQVLLLKARGDLQAPETYPELGPSLYKETARLLRNLRFDAPTPSPLLDLALVRERAEAGPLSRHEALTSLLKELCSASDGAQLETRDTELLWATFLEERQKRLALSDALGLSYGTYRRHLARAVRRLVTELEARERAARARRGG